MSEANVITKREITYILSFSRWKEDFVYLFILFTSSIIFTYYLPRNLSNIFFLILLFLFLRSEKNYFWFAFFFILVQGPAYFFSDFYGSSQYRLPIYSILPGLSFTPIDLFVILAFIKALLKGKKKKLMLKTPLIIILAYITISFIFTIIKDFDLQYLGPVMRGPFYYSIIISFSYLVTERKDALYFIYLVIPSIFFLFFTQLYFLITRNEFINLFYPGYRGILQMENSGQIRAIAGGDLLVLFCFVFSLFLLENHKKKLSNRYLYLISTVAYISVIISATRIWFVVFSFILFGYIFISKRRMSNLIKIFIVLAIIFTMLFLSDVISIDFLERGVGKRLAGILYVIQGKFHSVKTFEYRYFVRLPRVIEGVKKYIIFGCGFSRKGLEYIDFHVGFFNTILQFGIIGFSLFILFIISYFKLIKTSINKIGNLNPFNIPLKILALIFSGILIANFTTWFFFPMSRNTYIPFFISIFLSLTELFIREAENEENLVVNKNSRII